MFRSSEKRLIEWDDSAQGTQRLALSGLVAFSLFRRVCHLHHCSAESTRVDGMNNQSHGITANECGWMDAD